MILRSRSKRRGAIIVLMAFLLVPILGIVAIAIDGGVVQDHRRRVQTAADAAALAAAYDLFKHSTTNDGLDPSGTAAAAARTSASANGYAHNGTTTTVTVNIPPTSGSFVGKPDYAEVIVQYNQPRGFSAVMGTGALPIIGRAVAKGAWRPMHLGIMVLDPTGQGALNAGGGGLVNVTGGASVIVNSNHPAAAIANGGGTLAASTFEITGEPGTSTPGGGTFLGTIHSGVPPTPDPLSHIPPPNPLSLPVRSTRKLTLANAGQTVVLQPGLYIGGISITGQATVIMQPGIYYMQGGGFSYTGMGNLSGNGVMIYNDPLSNSDVISLAGQGAVSLTPMPTGPYAGITFFQRRDSTAPLSVTGNGNMYITGTFYAQGADLNVSGNGGGNVMGSQYISYHLILGGNGNIQIDWNGNTARSRTVGLVE
jgi:hypothetical protein